MCQAVGIGSRHSWIQEALHQCIGLSLCSYLVLLVLMFCHVTLWTSYASFLAGVWHAVAFTF